MNFLTLRVVTSQARVALWRENAADRDQLMDFFYLIPIALALGAVGFAAAQLVFGFLAFIAVNRHAVPLDDSSLSITQRFSTGVMPAVLAVRPPYTVHRLIGSAGLDRLIESICSC